MSDVNKQLLDAAKALVSALNDAMPHMSTGHDGVGPDCTKQFQALIDGSQAIAAAEQAQQATDDTRVAWTSLGTVKAMLPELLASDDVKVRENAQVIDALVKLVGCQSPAVAVPSRMSYKNATQEFADGYNACIDEMLAAAQKP